MRGEGEGGERSAHEIGSGWVHGHPSTPVSWAGVWAGRAAAWAGRAAKIRAKAKHNNPAAFREPEVQRGRRVGRARGPGDPAGEVHGGAARAGS